MMMMMMMNRYGCRFENGRRKSNFDCTMCRRNDDCIYGEISWEERMMYLMYFEASKKIYKLDKLVMDEGIFEDYPGGEN